MEGMFSSSQVETQSMTGYGSFRGLPWKLLPLTILCPWEMQVLNHSLRPLGIKPDYNLGSVLNYKPENGSND